MAERKKSRGLTDRRLDGLLTLGAAVLMLCVLFLGGEIGLANNGDFQRVMATASLRYGDSYTAFGYVGRFVIDLPAEGLGENLRRILFDLSTVKDDPYLQALPVRLSVALNLMWNALTGGDRTVYRLGVLGVLHTLLMAGGLYLLFRQLRFLGRVPGLIAKGLIVFVLLDVGYVAYFNSLYGEALQIIALVYLMGAALKVLRSPSPGMGAALWSGAAALVYGWSKFANIPAGALMALALETVLFLRSRKKSAVAAGALSILILLGVYARVPVWMDNVTNFNSVFYGILQDTDRETSERYLTELRLDPALSDFAGESYYATGVPAAFGESGEAADFYRSVSKPRLLGFYLTHPRLLLEKCRLAAGYSGMVRPFYLSNYPPEGGRFRLSGRFGLWSRLRPLTGLGTLGGNLLVLLAALGLLIWHLRKDRPLLYVLGAALLGVWLYWLMVPYISNGAGDLAKHMFPLAQLSDALLLAVAIGALHALGERRAMIPRGAAVLAAVGLILTPAAGAVRAAGLESPGVTGLSVGSYVRLGGETWLVADTVEGAGRLLCRDVLEPMAFSADDRNYWPDSDLRSWLNGPFLERFPPAEQALLRQEMHRVILSSADLALASAGSRDFTCSHLLWDVGQNTADAWQTGIQDRVVLPDAELMEELSDRGYRLTASERYWLMTPYFGNGSMVRAVYPEGQVYFQDAREALGVRPVVYVDLPKMAAAVSGGSGTAKDPYVLEKAS